MSAPAEHLASSYADYLQAEATAELRSEFFEGQMWMMTGGTYNHGLITMNLGVALANALRGRPCRVVSESVRVYFPSLDEAAYPDLRVVCGAPEFHPDDPLALINPVLVAEVLSDSTEAFDRGDKFARYRTLPGLREYLLASQHHRRLELFSRGEDGVWTFVSAEAGQRLRVPALGVEVAVDEVYDAVEIVPGSLRR